MFNVIFNGEFEVKYPNEFIDDLNKLLYRHNGHFTGNVHLQNLGEYVDFQEICEIKDVPSTNETSSE